MSPLNPNEIMKPIRAILNMIGDLEIHCDNKINGCDWTGAESTLLIHLTVSTCTYIIAYYY